MEQSRKAPSAFRKKISRKSPPRPRKPRTRRPHHSSNPAKWSRISSPVEAPKTRFRRNLSHKRFVNAATDARACIHIPPDSPPWTRPAEPTRSYASARTAPFSIPESSFPWQTKQQKRNTPARAAAEMAGQWDLSRRNPAAWIRIAACPAQRLCKLPQSIPNTISEAPASPPCAARCAAAAPAPPRWESANPPPSWCLGSPEQFARAPQAAVAARKMTIPSTAIPTQWPLRVIFMQCTLHALFRFARRPKISSQKRFCWQH